MQRDWFGVTDYDLSPVRHGKVGDIVKIEGKNFRIDKKTLTAAALTRYYWWDRIWDKLFKGDKNA